jgi:hypothetical protein
MSEGRTWSSEDTGLFSFKVFFGAWLAAAFALRGYATHRQPLPSQRQKRIVFAAEGFVVSSADRFTPYS